MDLRESIKNQTDVSLTLSTQVLSTEPNNTTNVVFSPLSIQLILGLIASGSKGPTQHQLLTFLKSNSTDELNSLSSHFVNAVFSDGAASGGSRLAFANGVWVDESMIFKARFQEVLVNVYKAASHQVDFQTKHLEATSEVNEWAEKETSGLIKEILPAGSVEPTTRLIFANALYFQGTWNDKFNASKTKEHDFHLLNGTSVQVPFMTSKKNQYVRAFDGFKVLSLPYKQGEDERSFSMYLFLPDALDGLPALVNKVSSEPGFLDHHLPCQQVALHNFLIPKFKLSFGFEASKVLQRLGLVSPFSDDGLTEMVDSLIGEDDLYVSSIFQKSFIELNEEGTEAAAASAARVLLRKSLARNVKLDFVADHPFLFLIRENTTGAVLFTGQVVNPLN